MMFKVEDTKLRLKWLYTWDVDSTERVSVSMKVYSGGHFSYEMWYSASDVASVLRAYVSDEFWEWLPDT